MTLPAESSGPHPVGSNTRAAAAEMHEYLKSQLTSSTFSDAQFSIPIIDLTPSFSGSPSARQAVALEMNKACLTTGFFYITGHGIGADVTDGVLKLASRLFSELPESALEKIHMRHSAHFRGYEPAQYSSVNNYTSTETKAAFNWGYESGLDFTGGDGKYAELDGTTEGSKNQWPDEAVIPGFYSGIAEYYGQILQLARHLFRLFALALALPENYFDPLMTHPGGIARLIKYPPSKNPRPLAEVSEDDEVGLGAHTDYECFTLLLQDSTPGLEILGPLGQWVSARPVEGGLVVNVADFLMRWTNGLYKSTVHRVINRTNSERYSVPFFFSINYDETVETLPSCIGEGNPSKYPPISAGQYVLDRLALTVPGNTDTT